MSAPVCRGKIHGTFLPSAPGQFVFGLDDQVLQCPWHGWEYSLETGESLFSTYRGRLRVYTTEVRDERVYVHLRGRRPA
jgi:nitrite reductase/ring-hydroxylating ferredoxin subunit